MATKQISDLGVTSARVEFQRDAGSGVTARVVVVTTRGEEIAQYTSAELAAVISAPADRTAIRTALGALYTDALARLGFA